MPSAFDNLIGALGNIGNAVGIQGANPTGYNALQRMAVDSPAVQAQGLATLATNKDFQAADPATRQAMIQQAAPSEARAQIATQYKTAASLPTDNPIEMTKAAVKGSLTTPEAAFPMLSNPMFFGTGGNANPPSTTQSVQTGQNNQPTVPALDEEGIDQNYLKNNIPPYYQNQVLDVIHGGELPKDISPKDRTMLMNMAHNAAPGFTESVGINRSNTIKDFSSSGKSGQALTSIGIGTKHLAQWTLAGLGLNNVSSPLLGFNNTVNDYKNSYNQAAGNTAITAFNGTAGTVAPEIAKAANSGGEVTDADKQTQRKDLSDPSMSPAQFAEMGATKTNLLNSKGQELGVTYRKNMGPINPHFTPINEQTAKTQNDLKNLAFVAKLDPKLKGPQAQAIIQRLHDAIALPDDAYLAPIHATGTTALQKPTAEALSDTPTQPKYQEGATYSSAKTGKQYLIKNGVPTEVGTK